MSIDRGGKKLLFSSKRIKNNRERLYKILYEGRMGAMLDNPFLYCRICSKKFPRFSSKTIPVCTECLAHGVNDPNLLVNGSTRASDTKGFKKVRSDYMECCMHTADIKCRLCDPNYAEGQASNTITISNGIGHGSIDVATGEYKAPDITYTPFNDTPELSNEEKGNHYKLSDEEFRTLVGMAIGRASMCWSETPGGVFDSTTASKLVDEICKAR